MIMKRSWKFDQDQGVGVGWGVGGGGVVSVKIRDLFKQINKIEVAEIHPNHKKMK